MGFLESSLLADDGDLQRKVEIALLTACKDVMAEVNTVASHAARVTFAKSVIANPADYILECTKMVVTNVSIVPTFDTPKFRWVTNASDSDIQFTVKR